MRPQNMLHILHGYLSSDPAFSDDAFLNEWISEVIETGDYGFEDGLLGLGWLICYLIQENYIQGDADEILTDIDDTIYKLAIKEVLEPEYNVKTLLYFVTYYQQRLHYTSKEPFLRRFVHFECMKLLLEKLNRYLFENRDDYSQQCINSRVSIILKYSYLTKTCVNETLVEEAFYTTIERLITFFEGQEKLAGFEQAVAKLYLCVQQYENPHWVERISPLYATILQNSDRSKEPSDTQNFWMEICSYYPNPHPFLFTDHRSKEDLKDIFLYLTNIKFIKPENIC